MYLSHFLKEFLRALVWTEILHGPHPRNQTLLQILVKVRISFLRGESFQDRDQIEIYQDSHTYVNLRWNGSWRLRQFLFDWLEIYNLRRSRFENLVPPTQRLVLIKSGDVPCVAVDGGSTCTS